MSITLAAIRTRLDNILGDVVTGTTSAAGNEDKTTLQDVLLSRYKDHIFEGRVLYLPDVPEARWIEDSWQPEGIVKVFDETPFTSQVGSSVSYEIHINHPDTKKTVINQALLAAYPYFYKRIEDISLTGQGSSDTEYDIPVTFADGFPSQIWLKKTTSNLIEYGEFFDFIFKEVSGSKKFYADIPTDYTILLIGKTWLTQLTTDISTTELTEEQADIVCLKAAANLYRLETTVVNSEATGRFDVLANQRDLEFERLVRLRRMPELIHFSMDWSWLE